MMLASLVVAMILPGSHAGHGLDNNWTVAITGMKDANDCLRVSSIEDLGANLAGAAGVSCVSSSSTCTDNYDCDAAKAKKPSSFAGCTFDSSSASAVTMVGVLMDGLCHDNFVVEQKNFNGAPGLAPDKVHVRSEAHLHTRACLVVDYCAATGFYLLQHSGSPGALTYSKLARTEKGSEGAEKVFDWLMEARHPCGTTTTTTTMDGVTTSDARMPWLSLATTTTALTCLTH